HSSSELGAGPELGSRAARGAMLGSVTSIAMRALGLVGTLVLVRYLAPAEYGAVSAAAGVVWTASQLSPVGIGTSLISYPKSDRVVRFHASILSMGLGALAFGLVLLFGGRFGSFLDAPTLARFLPGLVLAAVLDRLSFLPERLLYRELRFERLTL